MRGIAIREELTDEWQKRGAKIQKDYEILTAEISKASFGITPGQYKNLKGLIFTMLGERATTEIHRVEDSRGMPKLKTDARTGGDIAGGARKKLEKRLGRSIVSPQNYLPKKRKTALLQDVHNSARPQQVIDKNCP